MVFTRVLYTLIIILSFSAVSYAQPYAIPPGARCDECGMAADANSKFVSVVIERSGKKQVFCDIGDMLLHFRTGSRQATIGSVYIRDYNTGEWIDGKSALYVMNKKLATPMAWGIAGFKKTSEAEKWGTPVDFDKAFNLAR
jgi:copper chaperone NosL